MRWPKGVSEWASLHGGGLLDLLCPRTCEVCGAALVGGERHVCLRCMMEMPRTGMHRDDFNTVIQRLAPERVERAAAMFPYYRDGAYARIIHAGKYMGRPCVVRDLSRAFALELAPEGFFEGVDCLAPVPMHWYKLLKRGYNQAHEMARGVSQATGLPVVAALRAGWHATQTRRGTWTRWLNVSSIYRAAPSASLAGRHVLLVDDVVTTGATLLACVRALCAAHPGVKVSIFALGATHLR